MSSNVPLRLRKKQLLCQQRPNAPRITKQHREAFLLTEWGIVPPGQYPMADPTQAGPCAQPMEYGVIITNEEEINSD